MKVLDVVGCCSSVVKALVARDSGPGFDSLVTTTIFYIFTLLFFFIGQNLITKKYYDYSWT